MKLLEEEGVGLVGWVACAAGGDLCGGEGAVGAAEPGEGGVGAKAAEVGPY